MALGDRTRRRLVRAVVALAAGVAGLGGSYAVAGYSRAFLAAPVNDILTRTMPGVVIAQTITTLGDLGHVLAFGTAVLLSIAGLATLAYAGLLVAGGAERPLLGGLVAAVGAATAAYLLSAAGTPSLAAGAMTGAIVALGAPRSTGEVPVSTPRRQVLAATGAGAVTALAGLGLGQRGTTTARPPVDDPLVSELLDTAAARSLAVQDLDPLVSEGHYVVDIANPNPAITDTDWELSVTGAVETDRTFDLQAVREAPTQHRFVTLRCVGDPLNGRKIDTALWTGTPITDLLPEDLPENCCVMLRAEDDYYEEFPLSALQDGFLAYEMNGRPLPEEHGHPVRALIPGHWGEINVKWLSEIEILEEPAKGFWEKRGWHGTGPVNTVAKIHAVRDRGGDRIRVAGHAYAGTRGIERVEVSTDGGTTWEPATLSEPLPGATDDDGTRLRETAMDAWRMWEYEYTATEPHEVVVRAIDGTGTVQPETEQTPYPRGATGWVSRSVTP